ncbi:VOC family protein [Actinokineospora globicatena]|uniref:Glyoxalase n=1 Tax=Actinokineospora globicatena TaxID=103729 RepID=A0A9W6QLV2_9PSEU|nr:VOC family protein [Actinokineospora globicatena]MCP2304217.1 Glyoxalase-like domain-containing protein [Actinokineospora globicatena]GLW91030.1 glyoxalase [Actinokineospora globicatena]
MTIGIAGVTIDCADPRTLAGFWTKALGFEVAQDFDGEFLFLGPPGARQGEAVFIGLQRVPEERAGKNRVHLDFHTEDRAAEVARLVGLGATDAGEHEVPGLAWTVLRDPEGNEFCVGANA